MESLKPVYLRVNEFFRSSQPSSIAEDARKELQEERRKTIIDLDILRYNQDYSFLANQVIGAEHR